LGTISKYGKLHGKDTILNVNNSFKVVGFKNGLQVGVEHSFYNNKYACHDKRLQNYSVKIQGRALIKIQNVQNRIKDVTFMLNDHE